MSEASHKHPNQEAAPATRTPQEQIFKMMESNTPEALEEESVKIQRRSVQMRRESMRLMEDPEQELDVQQLKMETAATDVMLDSLSEIMASIHSRLEESTHHDDDDDFLLDESFKMDESFKTEVIAEEEAEEEDKEDA